MAIYQFYLAVIPRKGLLEKYEQVPNQLEVDLNARTKYNQLKMDGLLEESDQFTDALTKDWWNTIEILPIEIIHEIDKLVKRANYSSDNYIYWKFYSRKVDNDANLAINSTTGKIEQLTFRADLREPELKFLKGMIELGKKYEWLFLDIKGNLSEPDLKSVGQLAKRSNAYKFLSDPEKYLKELNAKKTKK